VPALLDRAKWAALPAENYDVIVLDSWGSFTEGVSEKEARQFQQALATLKDLARRGPGVLVLANTTKSAENYRGRGELADAIDILYEARDCTQWTPPATGAWWEQLPEAGEQHWSTRASRQHQQALLRLAFVPSKFRLEMELDPFILELDMRSHPWTLRDVTARLVDEAQQAAKARAAATRDTMIAAIAALRSEVGRRDVLGTPMVKKDAETFLMNHGITQKKARNIITIHTGIDWILAYRDDLPGKPCVLRPSEGEKRGENIGDAGDPHKTSSGEANILAVSQQSRGENMPSAHPHETSSENGDIFAV
jgi:hypothetical protein